MNPGSATASLARFLLAIGLFVGSGLAGSSQTTNRFFEFIQAQSQRRYSEVPREVLAAYYVWYGQPGREGWGKVDGDRHEASLTPHFPIKGAYSSHDPAIIDWHIEQAKSHGITAFATSWWGMGDWESWIDKAFPVLLERAEKSNFKIALYWEQAPGEGEPQIERAVNELSYALNRYGKSKAFLKVHGKPVIMVYGRVIGQVPVLSWPRIIEGVRTHAGDFILIPDGYQSSYAYLFDGLHTYALDGDPTAQKPDELPAWAAQFYADGIRLARKHGRISCVTVSPGFDNTKMSKPGFQTDRRNGERYRKLWLAAIKANPDWVHITSWNEWGEGTEIEPSHQLGTKYLELTAEYARQFLHNPSVKVPLPAAPAKLTAGTGRALDHLLAGRPTGVLVLDRKNDVEFWAAYCGATIQRLKWNDLIDPKQFNAASFPLVIFVTGEHFTGTVKKTGDVRQSLVRYLAQGGLFMSFPVYGVWPLYYDDSLNGKPAAITDDLGLGVSNGWDQPPGDLQFKFIVNTNALSGLSATPAYPMVGDLRWRPATRARVSPADHYFPLVQLRDSGRRPYGEGAAYVEHRIRPISPGKTIFVSPRASDAFGTERFYPALFEFTSTKLKPFR